MKKQHRDEQTALRRWENEGGRAPSGRGVPTELERAKGVARAAFDATYDSSARGEHRYPDAHQSDAERHARHTRDALKRELGGTR
jgi:hypothetical protein